jgi:dehydrogenase/reductase SDR family member 7B
MNEIVVTGGSSGLGSEIIGKLCNERKIINISRTECIHPNVKNICINFAESLTTETLDTHRNLLNNSSTLINNAGIFEWDADEYDMINLRHLFEVNFFSAVTLSEYLLKHSSLNRIINVNSVSGLRSQEGQKSYSASKHAMKGYFDALAQEYREQISITNIFPAGINTPLWDKNKIAETARTGFMDASEVAEFISTIIDLPDTLIMKDVTLLPKNEWNA